MIQTHREWWRQFASNASDAMDFLADMISEQEPLSETSH